MQIAKQNRNDPMRESLFNDLAMKAFMFSA